MSAVPDDGAMLVKLTVARLTVPDGGLESVPAE